ncbi:hypothetical protein ACWGEU_20460 [Streptomyces goshikiensis]
MADNAEGCRLFSKPHDLIVLSRELGGSGGFERGELGHGLVPLGQTLFELGDLSLESFDLRGPGVDDLADLLQSHKAPLKLLARCW